MSKKFLQILTFSICATTLFVSSGVAKIQQQQGQCGCQDVGALCKKFCETNRVARLIERCKGKCKDDEEACTRSQEDICPKRGGHTRSESWLTAASILCPDDPACQMPIAEEKK